MIALDTNVWVRFLVEDDPAQCAAASALVNKAAEDKESIFVSDLVLAELVRVLSRAYRFSRSDISVCLKRIFHSAAVRFASPERVARAVAGYESGKADFADYLVVQHGFEAGARTLFSFDRKLVSESLAVAPDADI